MRDEALSDIVLETLRQYIRDVVDLDDILAMTDTAPRRTAEAQKVQRQLDKKRSEYERLQKLLMSLYWLFGHYHDNRAIDEKHILLWEQIVQVI